jgi:uncharacterized protein
MTAIVVTAPLVTFADRNDPLQRPVADVLHGEPGDLIVPAPVAAEADYILRRRLGPEPARLFLEDIAAGRYVVASLDREEYGLAAALDAQYGDLGLGLADLAVMIVAKRFETRRLVTFDERDFRAVTPLQGGTFTLLPADE